MPYPVNISANLWVETNQREFTIIGRGDRITLLLPSLKYALGLFRSFGSSGLRLSRLIRMHRMLCDAGLTLSLQNDQFAVAGARTNGLLIWAVNQLEKLVSRR